MINGIIWAHARNNGRVEKRTIEETDAEEKMTRDALSDAGVVLGFDALAPCILSLGGTWQFCLAEA